MGKTQRQVMAEIARLWLPPGQRERNLQALAGMVSPEALQEVRALLALGASDWERRYAPSAALAPQARAVLVGCFGGLLRIAYLPHA